MPVPDQPFCFPISCGLVEKPGVFGIGTGFLARNAAGTVHLITTAHTATKDNDFRFLERWPNILSVVIDGGCDFPLFRAKEDAREPRFRPFYSKEVMGDVLALPIENALPAPLADFHVFDLMAPEVFPATGFEVTSYGFPHIREHWPYWPPNEMRGKYLMKQPNPGSHLAWIGIVEGHSGGPVLDQNGSLLGMGLGQIAEGEPDIIMPPNIILFAAR